MDEAEHAWIDTYVVNARLAGNESDCCTNSKVEVRYHPTCISLNPRVQIGCRGLHVTALIRGIQSNQYPARHRGAGSKLPHLC